jgi:hypothetical protein
VTTFGNNLATEQGIQAVEQGVAATMQSVAMIDQTMATVEQTTDMTFQQAVIQLSTAVVPGLTEAAFALTAAAGELTGAASALAMSGAAGAGAGAAAGAGHTGGLVASLMQGFHEGGNVLMNGTVTNSSWAINGSDVEGFSAGGLVSRGNKQADSTTIAATKGEFVMQEPIVRAYGVEFFRKLNSGKAQVAFDSLALPEPSIKEMQKTDSSPRHVEREKVGGGAGQGRDRQSEGLKIMNIMDPRMIETYLASPRGSKVVQNLAVQGLGKMRK